MGGQVGPYVDLDRVALYVRSISCRHVRQELAQDIISWTLKRTRAIVDGTRIELGVDIATGGQCEVTCRRSVAAGLETPNRTQREYRLTGIFLDSLVILCKALANGLRAQ
jgi:hypothetical protein